jgi:hypothetical protein
VSSRPTLYYHVYQTITSSYSHSLHPVIVVDPTTRITS